MGFNHLKERVVRVFPDIEIRVGETIDDALERYDSVEFAIPIEEAPEPWPASAGKILEHLKKDKDLKKVKPMMDALEGDDCKKLRQAVYALVNHKDASSWRKKGRIKNVTGKRNKIN